MGPGACPRMAACLLWEGTWGRARARVGTVSWLLTAWLILQSYTRSAAFIVTLHPLQSTTPDFWRLVYDYGCTSIVMLNQLHQSNSAWVRSTAQVLVFKTRSRSWVGSLIFC